MSEFRYLFFDRLRKFLFGENQIRALKKRSCPCHAPHGAAATPLPCSRPARSPTLQLLARHSLLFEALPRAPEPFYSAVLNRSESRNCHAAIDHDDLPG